MKPILHFTLQTRPSRRSETLVDAEPIVVATLSDAAE